MSNVKYINNSNTTTTHEKNGVTYLTFKNLDAHSEFLTHAFSTRLGGVSSGHLGTMDLSFNRGDDLANVMENHRRLAEAVGYDHTKLVFSNQVHETRIYKATAKDAGKGITKESDIIEYDGLMTDVVGLPLITFYADCVPIYFYDPVNHVAAMNHSGWRGTVKNISSHMVSNLKKEYGVEPENLICAIGPSICKSCYEVSQDVVDEFEKAGYSHQETRDIITPKQGGKYLLDLHKANFYNLTGAGVRQENISITDICTCCNKDFLFSHRASGGRRGNLGAIMCLKEKEEHHE